MCPVLEEVYSYVENLLEIPAIDSHQEILLEKVPISAAAYTFLSKLRYKLIQFLKVRPNPLSEAEKLNLINTLLNINTE